MIGEYLEDETYGFINVIASKICISSQVPQKIEVNKEAIVKITIEAKGVVSAKDVAIRIVPYNGIKIENKTTIILGSIQPLETIIISILFNLTVEGIHYIEIIPTSSNAYCESEIITLEGFLSTTIINSTSTSTSNTVPLLSATVGLLGGICVTLIAIYAAPRVLKLFRKWHS